MIRSGFPSINGPFNWPPIFLWWGPLFLHRRKTRKIAELAKNWTAGAGSTMGRRGAAQRWRRTSLRH